MKQMKECYEALVADVRGDAPTCIPKPRVVLDSQMQFVYGAEPTESLRIGLGNKNECDSLRDLKGCGGDGIPDGNIVISHRDGPEKMQEEGWLEFLVEKFSTSTINALEPEIITPQVFRVSQTPPPSPTTVRECFEKLEVKDSAGAPAAECNTNKLTIQLAQASILEHHVSYIATNPGLF